MFSTNRKNSISLNGKESIEFIQFIQQIKLHV